VNSNTDEKGNIKSLLTKASNILLQSKIVLQIR